MKELSAYTAIELLKYINDIKSKHDTLKDEIIQHTNEIDDIEKIINDKLDKIKELEDEYIILIDEFNNRN
jgi:uncharacterized coiled-coil DUF342 family protein